MITRVFQSLRDAAWHPDDEQLVAFIDAELGQRDSARVRRHLAHCWACRGRERRLAETIDAFMDAYAAHSFDEDDHEHEALLPHPARLPHAARAALREPTPAPALLARVRERVREAARETLSRVARQLHVPQLRIPQVRMRQVRVPRVRLPRVRVPQVDVSHGRVPQVRVPPGRVPQVRVPQMRVPQVHVPLATVVRLGAACATALVIVLLTTGVPLSARQVVRNVDRAERGVLAATLAPVVYQRLEIAVRRLPGGATSRGTFELWTDVERHRHYGAHDDGALSDLLALFARHGMTSAWPVSLRSYEQVRAAADDAVQERVLHEQTSDGERLLTLETTAVEARDESIDTRLVVRERDWHPIEQHLTVREGSATTEFVVRERGFEVVPLATLPVAFFDAPRLPEPVVRSEDTHVEGRRPVLPAASELVSAEVEAMFALHRVGLTAEDDIAVRRSESTIDVSGLTTTDARRRQLTDAIASIKHVRVRIRTTDEALSELSSAAPASGMPTAAPSPNGATPARAMTPATGTANVAADAASPTHSAEGSGLAAASAPPAFRLDEAVIEATRVPVHGLTAQSPPTERRADEASMRRAREAVRQSLALLERAWALRRLAEWSRRTNASTVTASTRELIDLMVREHADAASKALAALDTTVTPTLPSASRTTTDGHGPGALPAIDPSRAWVDVATDFFGVAAEIDRDTRRLFTASPTPTTEAVEEARRLRHGLDRAARSLLELRQPAQQP